MPFARIISSKVLNSYNEISTSSLTVFPLLSIMEFPVHVIVVPPGPVMEKLMDGSNVLTYGLGFKEFLKS